MKQITEQEKQITELQEKLQKQMRELQEKVQKQIS